MNLIDATNNIKFFELIAAIIGFVNYSKIKKTHWKYFPFFLFILFCLECYGQYLTIYKNYNTNINLYKLIVIPFLFYYYSFVFYKILIKKRQLIFVLGCFTFTLSIVFEYTILKTSHPFYASLSISIVNVFFLIYCVLYYLELINSDSLIRFYRLMPFWFSTGILVFYLGCLPYFGLYNVLATKFYDSIFLFYSWLFVVLNYLMYSFFSIGFIWIKKN